MMNFVEKLQYELTELIRNVNTLGSALADVDWHHYHKEWKSITNQIKWRGKTLILMDREGALVLTRATFDRTSPIERVHVNENQKKRRGRKNKFQKFFRQPSSRVSSLSTQDSNDVCPNNDISWREFETEFGVSLTSRSKKFCTSLKTELAMTRDNRQKLDEILENLLEIMTLMDANMSLIAPDARTYVGETFKVAKVARKINFENSMSLKKFLLSFPSNFRNSDNKTTVQESRSFPDAWH